MWNLNDLSKPKSYENEVGMEQNQVKYYHITLHKYRSSVCTYVGLYRDGLFDLAVKVPSQPLFTYFHCWLFDN